MCLCTHCGAALDNDIPVCPWCRNEQQLLPGWPPQTSRESLGAETVAEREMRLEEQEVEWLVLFLLGVPLGILGVSYLGAGAGGVMFAIVLLAACFVAFGLVAGLS